MGRRSMLSSNGKIIGKAKMNVQSSIINLFFPGVIWKFISEGELKIISFIPQHHKSMLYNVGHCQVKERFKLILLKGENSEQAVSYEAA